MTTLYDAAYGHLLYGRFGDLTTAALKLAYLTSGYGPASADTWWGDIVAYEVAGTGYPSGGILLSGRSASLGGHYALLNCPPAVLTTVSIVARYAVVYLDSGDAATSPLFCWTDLGGDVDTAGDDFPATFTNSLARLGPGA